MRRHDIQEMNFGFDMQGAQAIVNDPFIDSDASAGTNWVFVPRALGCGEPDLKPVNVWRV